MKIEIDFWDVLRIAGIAGILTAVVIFYPLILGAAILWILINIFGISAWSWINAYILGACLIGIRVILR